MRKPFIIKKYRSCGFDFLNAMLPKNQTNLSHGIYQFEAGMKTGSAVEEIPLYGHVSGTLTLSTYLRGTVGYKK